jgi:16S rRNA (guanine527-N7)-methyltransferase
MEIIRRYFPHLTAIQDARLSALEGLYREWNAKINVISRRDIDHLYMHHVLHSLAIAKYDPFHAGKKVLDAGTGGGFPGIPLAILYPEVQFTLLDATGKKIQVVNAVIESLGLDNVSTVTSRLEKHSAMYDIILSRAVSTLGEIVTWSRQTECKRWIILKGGDAKQMRKELPPRYSMSFIPVSDYFEESYFEGKYLIDILDTR